MHEGERQALITVHIHKGIHARRVHGSQCVKDLGGALECRCRVLARRGPLAVQIGAARIGAQVPAHTSVRVHIWHDVEREGAAEAHGKPVWAFHRQAEQSVEEALGKERGLRLAWMLAVDDPAMQWACACLDTLELAPVKRLA